MKLFNGKSVSRPLIFLGAFLVLAAIVGTVTALRVVSLAGTALQSGVVANAAPSVDAVVPSDASGSGSVALPAAGFTLNEGATRNLYVRGTVSDPNGCSDLSGVAITVYRAGAASVAPTDGMSAAGVLGQGGSFTAGTYTAPASASNLNGPYGSAIDVQGRRLFVSEASNNRVLEYDLNADGTPIDGVADHVLGQSGFTGTSANFEGSITAKGFNIPRGLAWDAANSRLFVTDIGNNRIVVFNLASSITDGMAASNVLGQATLAGAGSVNYEGSVTARGMASPVSLAWDAVDSRLFVADAANHRVLAFDVGSVMTDGAAATRVLGQADLIHNLSNRGGSVAANTVNNAAGMSWDDRTSRLFVGDTGNSRFLVFDLASGITNGMNAAHVLGQADFTQSSANRGNASPSANTLNLASFAVLDSASSRLFVSDRANNRILSFDLAGGITDGMDATHVIGQPDFTHGAANSGGLGASTLSSPRAMSLDTSHNRLFIPDTSNNRVLYYNLDAGSACTPDLNNCYIASVAKAALVGCTGAGVNNVTFEATLPMANFADPTDVGSPYSLEPWQASAVVTDMSGLSASLAAAFNVQSLAAFSVAPSLMDYGTIALGAMSAQQSLTFTNTGNRAVNSNVRADGAMHSNLTGFADIASTQSHYSVAQGTAWSAGTPIAASDTDLPIALQQQTADAAPAPTAPAYFYLKLPASGIRGTYANTLFFTAYAP